VRIRFTPSARRQFLAAIDRIRQDNPTAAKKFRRRAETTLRRLSRFPDSGRRIPEFVALPFREVVVPPLRFFYRQEAKVVWIAAVWHGAQIPSPPT
jgi:toxin ParE1/3/4